MKKVLQKCFVLAAAALMAVAPGMNFEVQRKVLPDGIGLWDMLYQAVARTTAAFSTDRIALAVLFAVFVWLGSRCFFRADTKPRVGEYVLSAFLGGMMLLNRAIRIESSVRLLYDNAFQVLKSALYFAGMFFIFLVAVRLLDALLEGRVRVPVAAAVRRLIRTGTPAKFFMLLAVCWLPQVMIRYPGVLMWDTYLQIKQFVGETARISSHPPFGTLVYGLMYQLGVAVGNVNVAYLAMMLLQVAAMLAVLTYSLTVMRRLHVPDWVIAGAALVYALSPCYAGWATVICKDTAYLTLCLLIGILLLEFALDRTGFVRNWRKMAWLSAGMLLLWLTRYNGALIVTVVYAAMLLSLLVRPETSKRRLALALCGLVTVLLGWGANEVLLQTLNVQKVFMQDVLTIPFQQTALVAKRHSGTLPQAEVDAVNRVLDYQLIAQRGGSWYADAVKDTYRQTASAADRAAYFKVWLAQTARYPLDSLDALLIMNGNVFDLQFNRPMYVGLSDNALYDYVYPYSFNDMKMYNRAQTVPLDSAQRMLTQWYMSFDTLPLIGWFANMGFCADLLLMIAYLAIANRRRKALWVMIPSLITLVGCLFSPVAYLRYALPYICSLPLWVGAYEAARMEHSQRLAATGDAADDTQCSGGAV